MVFAFAAKDLINQLAFSHCIVNMNMQLLTNRTQLFFIHTAYIKTRMFFNGIINADTFKRCFKRNGFITYLYLC